MLEYVVTFIMGAIVIVVPVLYFILDDTGRDDLKHGVTTIFGDRPDIFFKLYLVLMFIMTVASYRYYFSRPKKIY
jgi:hypothetical protein